MNAKVPLQIRLIVVSWPANSNSEVLTSTSCRVKTPFFSPLASTEMKSSPGLTMRSSTSGETYSIIPRMPSVSGFMRSYSPRPM